MKKAGGSRKTKPGSSKPAGRKGSVPVGEREVTIDRRRAPLRHGEKVAGADVSPVAAPKLERRKKVNRRRQIDPTTCERDYTGDEIEFMNALDDYKRKSGRMFPTCSEVLEVVRSLGYAKRTAGELATGSGADSFAAAKAESWFAPEAEEAEATAF